VGPAANGKGKWFERGGREIKTFIRFIGAALPLGATAAFVSLSSCGEPYYFPASAWEIKGIPPGGCVAMACDKDAVYCATYLGKILKFDGDAFTEDYAGRESVQFYDIAFFGNDAWAVGGDNKAEKPFIVRNAGGRWEELVTGESEVRCFTQVVPVGGGRCWLVAAPACLLFWDGTCLKRVAGGSSVNGACYDRSAGILYVYRPIPQGEWELLITADGGKSWLAEKIPPYVNGLRVQAYSWAAAGGALYFAGPGTSPIIKRTGGGGAGKYEMVFRSGICPNFRNVKTLAFNDLGNGVAVGDDTTVVITPRDVYLEETIDVQFKLVTPDSTDGFWALASDPVGLYYRR
jgi:hypothetical protein